MRNYSKTTSAAALDVNTALTGLIAFAFAVLLISAPSLAAATLDICGPLKTLLDSPLIGGLATIVVISLGVGAMYGKVSWGMASLAAVGIGATLGAVTIQGYFVTTASAKCV